MIDVRTYTLRLRNEAKYYFGGLFRELNQKDVFLWGQAIAFKVLVTVVPVIILATGVFGEILKGRFGRILRWLGIELPERPFDTVADFLRDFVPAFLSDQIIGFLDVFQGASNTFTLIGIVGLLFSAMTLFTTLRLVISNVFQEDWHQSRSIFGGYVFDIRMALQVGVLFLLTFGLSLTIQTINAAGPDWLANNGLDAVWVRTGWRQSIRLAGLVVPLLISAVMFFQLFYFIPKPRPPKRSAFIGACVTAVLWELAKFSFTFYATRVGTFDRYAGSPSEESLAVLGNTFGLIIAFVFWTYYSGVVLIIGGLVALLHEKHHRHRTGRFPPHRPSELAEPEPYAEADTTTKHEPHAEDEATAPRATAEAPENPSPAVGVHTTDEPSMPADALPGPAPSPDAPPSRIETS